MWLQKEEGDCSRSRLPGPQLSWAHTSPHSIKRHRIKFNTQVGAWEATGTEQDPKVHQAALRHDRNHREVPDEGHTWISALPLTTPCESTTGIKFKNHTGIHQTSSSSSIKKETQVPSSDTFLHGLGEVTHQ